MAKLSLEEFKELRAQGLDTEQIVSFEDRRRTEIKETKSKASLLDFIKKDLFTGGVTDEETPSGIKGFAADVFRTTIGSKGIAGSGQLLGRTLSTTGFPLISKGSAKERVELEESRGGLSDLTTKLIERYDVQPEGLEREKMKKIILNNIKEMGLSSEASKKLEEQVVSGREIASTTIRAGTQAALLATPIQSTIKGAIAEGAIGTGLLGAADAIEDGDDAKTIAKKTFRNAMIGGAIAGTLKGVQKLATGVVDYATKNAPKQLMNMALHTTKKIRESGKGIQQLLDDKVFGTLGTIQNKINAGIETVNTNISNALSGSKRKVVSKFGVKSRTKEDLWYEVTVFVEDRLECECPSGKFADDRCWHRKLIRRFLNREILKPEEYELFKKR